MKHIREPLFPSRHGNDIIFCVPLIVKVGVPLQVAKTMTYPERVNNANIEVLKAMVVNGAITHPGANVIRPADPRKYPKTLIYANLTMRKKLAEELRSVRQRQIALF